MNAIEELLSRVPVTEGFVALHLVDAATGQILASRHSPEPAIEPSGERPGMPNPDPDSEARTSTLAETAADVVRLISSMTTAHDVEEDLEDLVVTLTDHHHLVRPVAGTTGIEGAFLLLTLDRTRSNLALARHLLLALEAGLVA